MTRIYDEDLAEERMKELMAADNKDSGEV